MQVLNFQLIKEYWKKHCFHKKILSTNVFNIDNKKKGSCTKSEYLNDFWRIMWRWRQNDAENSALPSQRKNKYACYLKLK